MANDIRFGEGFEFFDTEEGKRVSFTRSERRALQLLAANPNRIVTRDQILDSVSEPGSSVGDRAIDFLINRLRRKLSDNAREPSFIETRYGEGYVWINDQESLLRGIADSDLVVGPVTGLDLIAERDDALEVARELFAALAGASGTDRKIVFAPEFDPAVLPATDTPDHFIELSFFSDRQDTSCVIAIKETRTGIPVSARRLPLHDLAKGRIRLEDLAETLIGDIWSERLARNTRNNPLPVSLFETSAGPQISLRGVEADSNRRIFTLMKSVEGRSLESWEENELRLKRMLARDPDNSELKLLKAVCIHSKYVMAGIRIFSKGSDDRQAHEDEIETLVTEALPYIRTNPEYAIMAGKLLHFLQRGYDDLAFDICERAYAESVSIANSLSVIGQLRAFKGETDAALECLEQALNLSTPGSHAHAYALIIKCQALASDARWDALRSACEELGGVSKVASFFLQPMFSVPGNPSLRARAVTLMLSRNRARAMLMHLHYVGARLFSTPDARDNVMGSLHGLIVGRFGGSILPDEIRAAYPGLPIRNA